MNTLRRAVLFAVALAAIAARSWADGSAIDKVESPYVQLLEHELEYRTLYQRDTDPSRDGGQWHRLGIGRSLAEDWSAELELIGEQAVDGDFGLDAFEVELKHQLTEQGEYGSDWGLLFEVERSTERNTWEAGTTLIAQRDWQRWTGTLNLGLIYEWGGGVNAELETLAKARLRYRYRAALEPGLEFYAAEDTRGIGPVLGGLWRIGPRRTLRWNAGIIFGVDAVTADTNLKLNLEYEF